MSPSTIDRLLHPYHLRMKRRPFSTTKPGTLLKTPIPIHTFAELDRSHPGYLETDTIAYCRESAEEFHLTTLSMVDLATGWIECQEVRGQGIAKGWDSYPSYENTPSISPPGSALG
ncbi:MAG: hypothetical protein JW732_09060 [Dehalococcoidia bacterium]|nr:hypothetical protein [Dehalococcoidia bacterium]